MAQNKDIFKIKHNDMRPQKGRILISEPFLHDICFRRSVVLLVEHNIRGSMGFVLNKCTDLVINDFVPEFKDLAEIPIYLGGPVNMNHLFFVHRLGKKIPDSHEIIDNDLCFDGDFEVLKRYILNNNPVEENIKFFLGYAGWTDNQLTSEIISNSWLISTSSSKDMMLARDDTFWTRSVQSLGAPYDIWTKYPVYPEMN